MDSEDKQRVSLYLDREAMKTVDVFSKSMAIVREMSFLKRRQRI